MPALMAPLRPAHAPYTAGRWPKTLVKLAMYPLASISAAYVAATAPVGSSVSGSLIQLIGPVSLRLAVGTSWCRAGQVLSRYAARGGPGADHDGCAELLGRRDAWGQPAALERLGGLRGLTPARLDQQMTTGRQPERRIGSDPAVQVQAVGPAVQGGGPDGLDLHRRIAADAPLWLAPGGHLLIETSRRQAPQTAEAFERSGLAPRVATSEELGATVVVGTRSASSGIPRQHLAGAAP